MEKLSETESLMIGRWIEEGNYGALEKWIADDPQKAREVFSQYRSLSALQEMERVIHLPVSEKEELTRKARATGVTGVKKLVVYLEEGLKILAGESHLLLPEPGFTRSPEKASVLDFGKFKVFGLENSDDGALYELKLEKCSRVIVEKLGVEAKNIYEGKHISEFNLSLQSGKYRIEIDKDLWELELK